jgi:hypothetical protein
MRERSLELSDRSFEGLETINRKLIRATLSEVQEPTNAPNGFQKKPIPPE